MNKALFMLALVVLSGCSGSTGDINSTSEIVRGCSYIACAIVTHGILGLFS